MSANPGPETSQSTRAPRIDRIDRLSGPVRYGLGHFRQRFTRSALLKEQVKPVLGSSALLEHRALPDLFFKHLWKIEPSWQRYSQQMRRGRSALTWRTPPIPRSVAPSAPSVARRLILSSTRQTRASNRARSNKIPPPWATAAPHADHRTQWMRPQGHSISVRDQRHRIRTEHRPLATRDRPRAGAQGRC
jgi:hypothetical protein